ncbi:hypothetical protein PA598K_01448 [Paenibacillus sp. 598K]|nr:hypothetical protein PA598K_01448 [Paenibacillus sp. 598K]
MKESEVLKLFSIIRTEHKNFEITDEKKALWCRLMKDITFETAAQNLWEHLRTSRMEPKASDLIRLDKSDPNQLRLHTSERMDRLEAWERDAIDCPPHILERLRGGGIIGD